ncbi:MAG: hypothetical protein M3Y74_00275 [Chloroflexota bacterium]|nr:hypothetical protein [Chloroflexota bacterium]
MKRRIALVLAALTLAVAIIIATERRLTSAGAVYTVARVRAGLARNPQAWVGRTILVRGLVIRCRLVEGCIALPPGIPRVGLVDGIPIIEMPRAAVLSQALPLQVGEDPLRSFLRLIPLLRGVVPAPRQPSPAQPTTYRVRLIVETPCAVANSHTSCVVASLIDTN